jgi:type I restriction enzyme S subunit
MDYIARERFEMLSSGKTRDGDVLFCLRGSLGKTALVSDIADAAIASSLVIVRPLTILSSKYLYYYLSSPLAKSEIARFDNGTAQPNLASKDLGRFLVPLAPAEEQERIVAAIEEQFSRLDAGVAALRGARQNLRRMRAAVLEAAIKGRLLGTAETAGTDDHAPGSELPAGWSTAPVHDITEVSSGITKNPRRAPLNNAIPFLRVANVMRGQLDLREVHKIEVFDGELERFRLQRGDLLVVEGNGSADQIGRSALWDGSIDPCVHQNHLIRVRSGPWIVPEYLNIFWNAPSSMATIRAAASSTSGLYTLSTGKVRNIQVTFPPLPVQHQIIEEVDRQLSALSGLDEQLGIAGTRARVLRAATLSAAFSGNLAAQDPSDEPASVLLEQIAVERTASNRSGLKRGRKPPVPREEVTA